MVVNRGGEGVVVYNNFMKANFLEYGCPWSFVLGYRSGVAPRETFNCTPLLGMPPHLENIFYADDSFNMQ